MIVYTVVMAITVADLNPRDPDYDDLTFAYDPEEVVKWELVVVGHMDTPAIYQDKTDAQKYIDLLKVDYPNQDYTILESRVFSSTPRPAL